VRSVLARIVIRGLGPRSRASPFDVGKPLNGTVAAYRLLQTRFDVRARPSSAVILARIGSANPSRGSVSPAFARCPSLSSRATRSEPNEFWRRRKPSSHRRGRSQELIRADRAERRTRALRELPSSCPCRAPLRRQPVAAKDLESPPPRRAPPLLLRDSGAWLACWPRSSFPRPPAKENVFPKTEVPSTVSSSFWVRGDRSSRPLGLGLPVTPPCLGPRFARCLGSFLFSRVALQSGSTSAFGSTPLAPKP